MIGPDTKIESIRELLNRIEQKRIECGMSKTELYQASQTTASAFSQWRSGATVPKIDTINRIAEVLHTTAIYLWSGFDVESAGPSSVSQKDARILSAYHRAAPADRAIIDNIVDRYADAEPVPVTKLIPLFGTSAAAGPGEPDTELPWEDFEVPQSSAAEFAIRVTGDSMSPELEDGQIALCVKRRPKVGDLAVLMVNGSMLVKQYINDFYGNVYLRSLNRKRRDCDYDLMASGNDTVMCFGIVLVDHKIPLVM